MMSKYAHRALEAEPSIGALLPCNVVVRQDTEGKVVVELMDPQAVLWLVERDDITTIAGDVRMRLQRVLDRL